MRKSPQQAIYDWVYLQSQALADTYDHLPMQNEDGAYPFINVGDTVMSPAHTKDALGGTFTQTVDVWGDDGMKMLVSTIADQLMKLSNKQFEAFGYHFAGQLWHHTCNITQDQSVPNTVFNRAQVTLIFELL